MEKNCKQTQPKDPFDKKKKGGKFLKKRLVLWEVAKGDKSILRYLITFSPFMEEFSYLSPKEFDSMEKLKKW